MRAFPPRTPGVFTMCGYSTFLAAVAIDRPILTAPRVLARGGVRSPPATVLDDTERVPLASGSCPVPPIAQGTGPGTAVKRCEKSGSTLQAASMASFSVSKAVEGGELFFRSPPGAPVRRRRRRAGDRLRPPGHAASGDPACRACAGSIAGIDDLDLRLLLEVDGLLRLTPRPSRGRENGTPIPGLLSPVSTARPGASLRQGRPTGQRRRRIAGRRVEPLAEAVGPGQAVA